MLKYNKKRQGGGGMNNLPLLAVDNDNDVFERENAVWVKRGFEVDRAHNMAEGIQKLMTNEYLFVAINGDVIAFMPMLRAMRNVTTVPIFVLTRKYTIQERIEAITNGADVYAEWADLTEQNVEVAMAFLTRHGERAHTPITPPRVIAHGELLIMPDERRVFVHDTEVIFTKTEFDILHYLRVNRGAVRTYSQIFREVWGEEYEDESYRVLHTHIKRMKQKLTDAGGDYIENVRNIGYRFINK
jgi:two-component system alkaline phosphatase synthesis response regulator PhoP